MTSAAAKKSIGKLALVRAASAIAVALAALPASAAGRAPAEIDIPAQDLGSALNAFGRQTGTEIAFSPDAVKGKTLKRPVRGRYQPDEALDRILDGSGLRHRLSEANIVIVSDQNVKTAAAEDHLRLAQTDAEESGSDEPPSGDDDGKWRPREDEDIITVVGTRIKGARPTSPVVTLTQEGMRRSGHNNLGEAIRALPQNFNGGPNPTVAFGAQGGAANQNISGGSSINLRGLGPDATLTLLNGARLPYDGFVQATDVTVVPVAAIERIEILLDGASAVYGSDAVGGVANIVLRRDFEGLELSARYGAATEGGFQQQQYTAVGGTNWGSGGFLLAGEFSDSTGIRPEQRDYLANVGRRSTLYDPITQGGGLFSGHQEIGNIAELLLDGFYTRRSSDGFVDLFNEFGTGISTERDSEIWGASPSLQFELPFEWSLRLRGFVGRNEFVQEGANLLQDGTVLIRFISSRVDQTEAASAEAEGPLFALPGGDARLSTGGGWRRNTAVSTSIALIPNLPPIVIPQGGDDSSFYGFGEINLPLIGEEQGVPLVAGFTLNGAVRHEEYKSFGAATTPKIGALWTPVPGLDLKASWGRSFKAPTLSQQHGPLILDLFNSAAFVGLPGGQGVMVFQGGNPDLGPERAEVITTGFVATPDFLPGFSLEFSWFDIDYDDRIVQPLTPFSQTFANPAFASFITLDPTLAEQEAAFALAGLPFGTFTTQGLPYDPDNVIAIVDSRDVNAAIQKARGVDLTSRYTTEAFGGNLTASLNASWLTSTRRLLAGLPEAPVSGLIFFPPKFRARGGLVWSRDGFTASTNINHIAGVTDTNVTPNVERESMTTVDLILDYRMESGPLGEIGFNLAVTNLFNEEPPFMMPVPASTVPYDSTNYSAIGRVVSATITKRF